FETQEEPVDVTFADWPALASLPEDQRGPEATPANDGVANLVKYSIGVGPLESASGRIPEAVFEGVDGDEGYPVVSYVRDTLAAGVTMGVAVSADLDFVTDLGSTVITTEDLGGGLERISVRSNASCAVHKRQFFKLVVVEN